MLRHLRVTNFAILSDVALDLGEGFNVLTGETGAGKSLIVEAVNLLRGGRASADIPRAGAKEATVEAIFELPEDLRARISQLVLEAGLPDNDGEIIVRRVIQRGGRSRTYVNGALTTATCLAELGALLVDLSGQHQHQGLVDAKRHREILDAFADNAELLAVMHQSYERLRQAQEAIAELCGDSGRLDERMDYLRFQLDEITAAALREREDEELLAERTRLVSVDRLAGGAARSEELLYGGDGAAVDRIDMAVRELGRLVDVDPRLRGFVQQLEEARVVIEDVASELRRYSDGLDSDPGRLAEVEERLVLIQRLTRKHGGDIRSVLGRAEELAAELGRLENREQNLAELEARRAKAEAAAMQAAEALSKSRRLAAERLEAEVGAALAELGMAAASLSVLIEERPLGPDGRDRVEFLLESNKGEGAKPLVRIASGGELSRIMLALKLCLRRADEVATYVFDEVDTGIGGATAEVVGHQIRALGNQRQVLCVTHLPQIVAFADQHFHVSKYEVDGRTETMVRNLTSKERRDELARMLGGMTVTASARAHAEAMLKAAAKYRPRA